MIKALVALASLALVLPSPAASSADAATPKPAKTAPSKKKRPAKAPAPTVELPALSIPAQRVTAWVAETGDNNALPYVVIDKPAAAIYAFDASGKPVGFEIGRAHV